MAVAKDQELATLLAPGEPAPYEIANGKSRTPIVLACDHSSNRMPRALGELGLGRESLAQHIAWDIGAGAVTRKLSERLDAAAVLGGYSRLVVDLNRDLRDPTAYPAISDGVLIPGNISLTVEERAERARVFFKPYHEVLRGAIQERSSAQQQPVLISIHSFTPKQFGVLRPWHVGILWDEDPRLALPLLAALRAQRDIAVGDNQPYSGRHPADYTIDHHAEPLGLSYAAIEIRQDMIGDESGQREWADRLAEIFNVLFEDKSLFLRPSD
ncbi:MAG: N-formylglutamate amidohydrolase [Gammaproteobacteria bacterium]